MTLRGSRTHAVVSYRRCRPERVLRSWSALVGFRAIRRNASHLQNPFPQPQPPVIHAPHFKFSAVLVDGSKKQMQDKAFEKFLKSTYLMFYRRQILQTTYEVVANFASAHDAPPCRRHRSGLEVLHLRARLSNCGLCVTCAGTSQ